MPAYSYSATSPLRRITSSLNFKEIKPGPLYGFHYKLFIMQETRKYSGLRQYFNNNESIFQTRKIYYHEKESYRREPRYIYHIIRREPNWTFTFHNF
jgi:hypothetical protein